MAERLLVAQSDKVKEEIGWLKLLFGLAAATVASLLGWMAHVFVGWVVQGSPEDQIRVFLLWPAVILVVYGSLGMVFIARSVHEKIHELGQLQ